LKERGLPIKSLCAHPGLAATNLQANTCSNSASDVDRLTGFLSQGQSAEDGTLPLLSCICNTDAESGDFYGPYSDAEGALVFAGDPMVGPPAKLTREEPLGRDVAAQEAMWAVSEAAVGRAFFT
jgi:protochlorophyllide reductase